MFSKFVNFVPIMTTKIPHYKGVFQNFNRGISPINTGRMHMKLRMEIPVHHAQCV